MPKTSRSWSKTPPPNNGRNPMFLRAKPVAPFTPTEKGCPVRDLRKDDPRAFQYWRLIYETRDRAERARAQSVPA